VEIRWRGRCAGRAFDRVDQRLAGLHRVPGELGCPTPRGADRAAGPKTPGTGRSTSGHPRPAPLSAAPIGRPALRRRITSSDDIVTLSDGDGQGERTPTRLIWAGVGSVPVKALVVQIWRSARPMGCGRVGRCRV